MQLLVEFDSVTQKVSCFYTTCTIEMSGRKYYIMPEYDDFSRESKVHTSIIPKSITKTQCHYRTNYGIDPPSHNAIQCCLQQWLEIDNLLNWQRGMTQRIPSRWWSNPRINYSKSTKLNYTSFFAVMYITNVSLEDCS